MTRIIRWPPEWQTRAQCNGMDLDLFFPEKCKQAPAAIRVCQSCLVRVECLEYALTNDEKHGVWGGLSPGQRHKIKQGLTL